MLNRVRLLNALYEVKNELFLDAKLEYSALKKLWEKIISDIQLLNQIEALNDTHAIPKWYGGLGDTHSIKPFVAPYYVISIDGSQIYPDKHQGISCYLINIGMVHLMYNQQQPSSIVLQSQPYVFSAQNETEDLQGQGQDIVDCRRQELELQVGLELCKKIKNNDVQLPLIFLFDGSLIFWHLNSKDYRLRTHFLNRYMQLLHAFYELDIMIVGYISLPKSRELVNIVKRATTIFSDEIGSSDIIERIVDSTLIRPFLPSMHRSTIFKSGASLIDSYPANLQPHFVYVNYEFELVRLEFPAWFANTHQVDYLVALIADQVKKGFGYPVALAEAHEQAVVKGPDRDFFYHVIQQMSIEARHQIFRSQKVKKKIKMAV